MRQQLESFFSKQDLDNYLTVIVELLKYQKSPIIKNFTRHTLSKFFILDIFHPKRLFFCI